MHQMSHQSVQCGQNGGWTCLVCNPTVFVSAVQKEIIISATADIHFKYCNPCLLDIALSFITEQTKCFNIAQRVHWWKDSVCWWDCIHWCVVSDFLEAQRPFLIMPFSQEDLAVIRCTIDVFPTWIHSYCMQTLYWVNFSSHRDFFFTIMNPWCQVNLIHGKLLESNEKIQNIEQHNAWVSFISDPERMDKICF